MTPFETIVTAVFVVFVVAGVAVFAIFGGAFGGGSIGAVAVWGTVEEQKFAYLLDSLRSQNSTLQDVTYVKKDPATYQQELLNAMAAGTGPDLFVVSQEQLGVFGDKVLPIPYGTVSQSDFINSYIDEGQLFLTSQGSLALPFLIDPLVMYWNRDLFSAASVASPPQYWNDFLTLAPKLTKLDSQRIVQSAVALGAWQNVDHAKAILSSLFMQAGERVTARAANDALVPVFGSTPQGSAEAPAESALRFYTEFGNPAKQTYSWSRSLPRSQDSFVSGQLAVYFGFASEYKTLAERNPNLRFAVAMLPQLQGSGPRATFGSLLGLAISRSARNPSGAGVVAQVLTGPTAASVLASQTGLPPARRDTATDTSANAAAAVFVQSALIARGWIDPQPAGTDALFKAMVESVISGALGPAQAVAEAAQGFAVLLPYQPGN